MTANAGKNKLVTAAAAVWNTSLFSNSSAYTLELI